MDEEGCTMTETRAIAHLPNLDIEFVRRELPDGGAEQIAVQMTARPSFEAFGAALRPPLSAMMAIDPPLFWFGVWSQAAKPWLRLPDTALEDGRVSEGSET
jgi:hypothetical protein